jgi:hypothetical protein
VDFLGRYLTDHFFRVNCPEKRGFLSFEFTLCQLPPLKLYFIKREHFCHDLWDPFFQMIWIQGSVAVEHVASITYFSKVLEG